VGEAPKVTFESSSSIPWQLVLDQVVDVPPKIEPVNLIVKKLHHNDDGYVRPSAARRSVRQAKMSRVPRKARLTQDIVGRLHHLISAHSDLHHRSAYHG
jgi:hypothetical protein